MDFFTGGKKKSKSKARSGDDRGRSLTSATTASSRVVEAAWSNDPVSGGRKWGGGAPSVCTEGRGSKSWITQPSSSNDGWETTANQYFGSSTDFANNSTEHRRTQGRRQGGADAWNTRPEPDALPKRSGGPERLTSTSATRQENNNMAFPHHRGQLLEDPGSLAQWGVRGTQRDADAWRAATATSSSSRFNDDWVRSTAVNDWNSRASPYVQEEKKMNDEEEPALVKPSSLSAR